jgi:uncharacterized protein YfaP (DUF2135 family)
VLASEFDSLTLTANSNDTIEIDSPAAGQVASAGSAAASAEAISFGTSDH